MAKQVEKKGKTDRVSDVAILFDKYGKAWIDDSKSDMMTFILAFWMTLVSWD
jgi:hypothetical protein